MGSKKDEKRKQGKNVPIYQNGQKPKNKEKKNHLCQMSSKPTGQRWSTLAIFNVVLFLGLLGTAGACLYVCADGDLSPTGIRAAIPKLNQNMQHLVNRTMEAVKIDNLQQTASVLITSSKKAWKKVTKFSKPLVGSLAKYATLGWKSLEFVTGDLSPYTDTFFQRSNEFLNLICSGFDFLYKHVQSYLSKADFNSFKASVHWVWTFTVEQFYILQEEIVKNKALVSIWQDMKPWRDSIWSNTEIARNYVLTFCVNAQDKWIPLLKNHTLNYLNLARQSIGNLV